MEIEQLSNIEIREATPEDATRARTMQAESWLATYPNEEHGVTYDWVKARTDGWLTPEKLAQSQVILGDVINDSDHFYRLAEENGEVLGFVHVATNDNGTKQLEAIYTDPKTFGSGLGGKLMALAVEWIDDATTFLEVATYNERAIKFYQKHGFEEVEGSEHLYADKIPVVTMIRKGEEHEV